MKKLLLLLSLAIFAYSIKVKKGWNMEQEINKALARCPCAEGLEETFVNVTALATELHELMTRRGREELESKYEISLKKAYDTQGKQQPKQQKPQTPKQQKAEPQAQPSQVVQQQVPKEQDNEKCNEHIWNEVTCPAQRPEEFAIPDSIDNIMETLEGEFPELQLEEDYGNLVNLLYQFDTQFDMNGNGAQDTMNQIACIFKKHIPEDKYPEICGYMTTLIWEKWGCTLL